MPAGHKIGLEGRKCRYQRQRLVRQRHGVIAGIPRCHPLALGVDDENDAAHFRSDAQAAARGRREKLPAESLPLQLQVSCEAREPEARHVVTGKPTSHQLWRVGVSERRRRQAVVAQNRLAVGLFDRDEGFSTAGLVALARVPLEELVERGLAAIEGLESFGRGRRVLKLAEVAAAAGISVASAQRCVHTLEVRSARDRGRLKAPIRCGARNPGGLFPAS